MSKSDRDGPGRRHNNSNKCPGCDWCGRGGYKRAARRLARRAGRRVVRAALRELAR